MFLFVCLLVFFCRKTESTLKAVRVQLDNGDRIVGIRYPEVLIPLVDQALREERAAEQMMQQQLQMVSVGMLEGGDTL